MRTEPVIEAGTAQTVAMRHLDRVDPGIVQRLCDRRNMIQPIQVTDRVHAVAPGDVLNIELLAVDIKAHAAALRPSSFAAISPALALAATVQLSKVPDKRASYSHA